MVELSPPRAQASQAGSSLSSVRSPMEGSFLPRARHSPLGPLHHAAPQCPGELMMHTPPVARHSAKPQGRCGSQRGPHLRSRSATQCGASHGALHDTPDRGDQYHYASCCAVAHEFPHHHVWWAVGPAEPRARGSPLAIPEVSPPCPGGGRLCGALPGCPTPVIKASPPAGGGNASGWRPRSPLPASTKATTPPPCRGGGSPGGARARGSMPTCIPVCSITGSLPTPSGAAPCRLASAIAMVGSPPTASGAPRGSRTPAMCGGTPPRPAPHRQRFWWFCPYSRGSKLASSSTKAVWAE